MNLIESEISQFLLKYNINDSQQTYLVAFSGGYDSMCLLHSLRKICKNKIVAIHLNHNWRGEESDKEEQNCFGFCHSIGVEFYSEKLPDDTIKNETFAREARYKFFEKCAQKFNSKIIFTAHNKNDNIETLVFRICHGTGINGLRGILPQRGIYYRPLLNVFRKNIEKYCIENNLAVNSDSSNYDTVHKRNLIRHEILPLLEKVSSSAMDSINSLSIIAREENEIVKEYISQVLDKISKDEKINTKEFLNLSKSVQKRIIFEIITPFLPENYDRDSVLTILNFIEENSKSKSGKKISLTNGKWVYVSEKYIELIDQSAKNELVLNIKEEGEYEFDGFIINISKCAAKPDRFPQFNSRIVYVDFSGLDFDFQIRYRQDGDFIRPLGLNGTQKLKKYLNERKIPNHEKDCKILLSQGKEILWCVDCGISDKIKVKNNPTHKIEIKERYER